MQYLLKMLASLGYGGGESELSRVQEYDGAQRPVPFDAPVS